MMVIMPDLDVELANLAENSIYYNSLVRFLSSQLLLRQAITEGRLVLNLMRSLGISVWS